MSILKVIVASRAGGKKEQKLAFVAGFSLTAGQLGCPMTDPQGKSLPDTFPFVREKDGAAIVTIPAGTDGKVGEQSFAQLRKTGNLKQQNQVEFLRLGNQPVTLQFADVAVRFSLSEEVPAAVEAPPAETEPPSFSAGNWQAAKRQSVFIFCLIFVLAIHIGGIAYLAMIKVPDEYYSDPTKIPDRFVKLFVKEDVKEEVKDTGSGDVTVAAEEKPDEGEEGEEGGGGDAKTETAAPRERSRADIAAKVRTKGVLALITSKGGTGGAIGDVLSSGAGLAGDLDKALGQVSGVGVAGPGVEIRGKRGGGGAGKAGIGALAAGKGRGGGLGTRKRRKLTASIKADKFETSGSLSPEVIRAIVQKNLRKIKFCYNRELGKNPDLKGKVEIEFVIGKEGRVTKYKVRSSTMNNDAVESCVLKKIRRFRFPKPSKGTVTVVYPFVFTTAG